MMPRRLLLVLGLVVAGTSAGCAGKPAVTRHDDGTLSVQCSGGYHDWSRCYQRVERACGGREVDVVSQVTNEGSSGVGTRDWSREGSEVSRTMVVRCR